MRETIYNQAVNNKEMLQEKIMGNAKRQVKEMSREELSYLAPKKEPLMTPRTRKVEMVNGHWQVVE